MRLTECVLVLGAALATGCATTNGETRPRSIAAVEHVPLVVASESSEGLYAPGLPPARASQDLPPLAPRTGKLGALQPFAKGDTRKLHPFTGWGSTRLLGRGRSR